MSWQFPLPPQPTCVTTSGSYANLNISFSRWLAHSGAVRFGKIE